MDQNQIVNQNQQEISADNINPISLLNRPEEFKAAFYSLASKADRQFQSKNYQKTSITLIKCVDMLDLGRNILKDVSRYWKIVCYGNLACCFHFSRKLSKCNKYCEKLKEELEKYLGNNSQKELFLKLSRTLIKIKFQHCAILSQLQQHEKAFQLCKSTLETLQKTIQILLNYIREGSASQVLARKSNQIVQFSRHVYRFGENLLNDLSKCLNQPLKVNQGSNFYYWQKNPQQNEEQVKKRFIPHDQNNSCKRSILGVSKQTHWIDQFNIGAIMHFSYLKIADFEINIPLEEYLFKDRLYQLVIYCSMAHFTMATQLRLVDTNERQKKNENMVASYQNNLMKKYGYEQKSEIFKQSQLYHLRSIDIMAKNLKTTIPYITHIIRSYQKHYINKKKILEPISAIADQSAVSINQTRHLRQKQSARNSQYSNKEDDYSQNAVGNILDSQQQIDKKLSKKGQYSMIDKLQIDQIASKINQNAKKKGQNQSISKLSSVKSAGNILRNSAQQNFFQQPQQLSSEYLKSQRSNRSSSKMKKAGLRQGSKSKIPSIKQIGSGHQAKDIHKMEKNRNNRKVTDSNHESDYKLKSNRLLSKQKQKQRRNNLKQKLYQLDVDKYGEKQIKIKTQSCTHIKVFYKKKKVN